MVGLQFVELLLEFSFLDQLSCKRTLHVCTRGFRKKDDRGHEIVVCDVEAHRNFDSGNRHGEDATERSSELNALQAHYRVGSNRKTHVRG